MDLRRRAVAMIWNDSAQIEFQRGGNTARYLRRVGVKNIGRQPGHIAVAREEIRAEQQLQRFAVKPHMSMGVAGQMNRAKPAPCFDEITIAEQAIRDERAKRQDRSADGLQPARDPRPAAIMRCAGIVSGVEPRGCNPRASLMRRDGHIEDMI